MGHFTTISKSINNKNKGVFEYLKYLDDKEQHPNDEIINFDFKRQVFMNNVIEKEKNLIKLRKSQKKANKAKNYCQSFMFSLPPQENPILKMYWNKIINDMIPEFYDMFNTTDIDFIKKNVYINVHHRKGSNSHLNIVFNKITDDGILDFSKKRFIHKLRTSFTKAAEKHLSIQAPKTEFEKKQDLVKKNNENLKEIIRGQDKVIKKSITQAELVKWTLIFIQNAHKYEDDISRTKTENYLLKAKNNINQIDDKEQKNSLNGMMDYFSDYSY